MPHINGEDLNSRPDLSPGRCVINFFDWPLDRDSAPDDYEGSVAADFPECLAIVDAIVKPQRIAQNDRNGKRYWWRFMRTRPELHSAIAGMSWVLPISSVSKHPAFAPVGTGVVFDHNLTVLALDTWQDFALLSSRIHLEWAAEYSSTLETRTGYRPSDCLETFPFPSLYVKLSNLGRRYHEFRSGIMLARQEGLTKTYNRFHDADESCSDIQKLRDLHVEMDKAVADAYGWDDLDLGHGFHETKQGSRFTIGESARREVLARLLKLNHERYAEEVKQGLHDKQGKAKPASSGKGRKSKAPTSTPSLKFGGDEDDPDPPDDSGEEPTPTRKGTTTKAPRADRQVQPTTTPDPHTRPTPIDQIETHEIMAAFRQAARNRGWLDRDELLKEVSLVLGYQRLGAKIEEALQGHLRAAIRRRIIETDGPKLVRSGTATMADYDLEELRESFRSVMRKGTHYEREGVISSLARYLGFVRLTDPIRQAIKSAITSAIRHGILRSSSNTLTRT